MAAVGGGKFFVVRGAGAASSKGHLIDVLQKQSQEDFDGATFLAASNFNCLEFVGPGQTAAQGVTDYVYDWTQGPFCALATGAALVYRNYFIVHPSGKEGQIEEQIRLLKDTPIDPFVENGYPVMTLADVKAVQDHNWDDLNQFYVGVHENCEVTTTRDSASSTTFSLAPPGRIVHHVYAATFNFAGSMPFCDEALAIAEKLLIAQYRATVLAAWELSHKYPGRKGSNKLVLTGLGGGVFANPLDMICRAIVSCKDLIVQSGLEVYMICWSHDTFDEYMLGLSALVTETHGQVIEAS